MDGVTKEQVAHRLISLADDIKRIKHAIIAIESEAYGLEADAIALKDLWEKILKEEESSISKTKGEKEI